MNLKKIIGVDFNLVANKKTTLCIGAILFCTLAWSQPKSFSQRPEVFIDELFEFLHNSNDKKTSSMLSEFEAQFLGNSFSEENKRQIIQLSNMMLLQKATMENFSLLLQTILLGNDSSKIDRDQYSDWLQYSLPILRKNKKRYLEILETSKGLFNEYIFFVSKSKKWYTNPTDYKLRFEKNDLLITYKNITLYAQAIGGEDKIKIKNTSGTFRLSDKSWTGKDGTIDWQRVGLAPENVFASFDDYMLRLNSGFFEADSALFTYKGITTEKLLGKLTDRLSSKRLTQEDTIFSDAKFPLFESYRNDISLGDFANNRISLTGGFKMKGNTFYGKGNSKDPAIIKVKYKDKIKMKASAELFAISPIRLSCPDAQLTFYTDSGTISHPRINIVFDIKNEEILAIRGEEGFERSPFINNDHQMELYVDEMIWNINQDFMSFKMSQPDATANFESTKFFKEFRYERIGRMLPFNPINRIERYAVKYRTRDFTLEKYAKAHRSTADKMKSQIIQLADNGFISYNLQNDTIHVFSKVIHYSNSHRKITDYDVLRFRSVIGKKPNATLSFINNEMHLQGVRLFQFSDSQNVLVKPYEQEVFLKHGRDLRFGGILRAGRLQFYAKNFEFSYKKFDIESQLIDSLRLFFPENNESVKIKGINSVLTNLNGIIKIDNPQNKSGLKNFPTYPKFISRGTSLVHYEKPEIHEGAYKKDDFRFEVEPFTIDSLDNFTRKGIRFPGVFKSAGIVPDMSLEIYIMDDYSLGFKKAITPYTLYGGKGRGEISLSLSNQGFYASGNIVYQGAEFNSDNILLLPKNLSTNAKKYRLAKNGKYPSIAADNIDISWSPDEENLSLNTRNEKISILQNGQTFQGILNQTPTEITGNGRLDWAEAKINSKKLVFGTNKSFSDSAEVQIKSIDGSQIAIKSSYINVSVDFNTRLGKFSSDKPDEFTQMPQNLFSTNLGDFIWDMDKKTIAFKRNNAVAKENGIFKSENPSQKGLQFMSSYATFDMNTSQITAFDVPYIDVADSRVFPFEKTVKIGLQADIERLKQSKILASRENKFHQLFNCDLKIISKYELSGNGKLIYKDKFKSGQEMYFKRIFVEKDSSIVAKGYVSDSMIFYISPKIAYRGKAKLSSQEKFIAWEGFVKPIHKFDSIKTRYLRFADQPNPTRVIVNANNPKDPDRRTLFTGISLTRDSLHAYPSFFSPKISYLHASLNQDTGIFFYDDKSHIFFVGDSNKLLNGSLKGNYIGFNDQTGDITAGGKFDLNMDFQDQVSSISSGNFVKKSSDSVFMIDAFLGLNLLLPKTAYQSIIEVIQNKGNGLAKIAVSNKKLLGHIAEFLSEKKLKKVEEKLEENGSLELPKELERHFTIASIKLFTQAKMNSLISVKPISLISIDNEKINQEINSKMEINIKRSGTRFKWYLEIDKYNWFYFDFFRGNLMVYSTEELFNQSILDRKQMKEINRKGYYVRLASPRTVTRWLDKINLYE